MNEGALMLRSEYTGNPHKSMKRVVNTLIEGVETALKAARETGILRNNLTRVIGTCGPIAEVLGALVEEEGNAAERPTIQTFTKFLTSTVKLPATPWLKPGLGNPTSNTATALHMLLTYVDYKAMDALKRGRVVYPRLGRLRNKIGEDQARILFHLDSSSKPQDVPSGNAKHAALWVARSATVDVWLRDGWRTCVWPEDVELLNLGVTRLVTSVSLHETAYTVSDGIPQLPYLRIEGEDKNVDTRHRRQRCTLELMDVDALETTRVYTLQLRSMHEELFLHESLRAMIFDVWHVPTPTFAATCSTASAGVQRRSSERILRNLLGYHLSS
jgi:hypothetical protein